LVIAFSIVDEGHLAESEPYAQPAEGVFVPESGPSEIAGPDVAGWNELWRDDFSEPERKPLSIFLASLASL
jgi:hypothetical protein